MLGFEERTQRLPIFDEAPLVTPGKHSLSRLSAVAWDLFLFRWCETLMTQMRDNSFYVPLITTLDKGLLDAIRSCPLRAVLMHDEGGLVEAMFDDEFDFQRTLDNSISDSALRRINDPERQIQGLTISRHALSSSIRETEDAISKLCRSGMSGGGIEN